MSNGKVTSGSAAAASLDDFAAPATWKAFIDASKAPMELCDNGIKLGATQNLTYAPCFRVVIDKNAQDQPYLKIECRLRRDGGKECEHASDITHGGQALEFSNAMRHLVAFHKYIINSEHQHLLKEKSAAEPDECSVFSRDAIAKEKDAITKLIITTGLPVNTFSTSSVGWTEYNASKRPVFARSTLMDNIKRMITDQVKKPNDAKKALLEARVGVYDFNLPTMYCLSHDSYKARNGESKTSMVIQFGAETVQSSLSLDLPELRPLSWFFALKPSETVAVETTDASGETHFIEMPAPHTSANIAKQLSKCIDDLDLAHGRSRALALASDTASNVMGVVNDPCFKDSGLYLLEGDGGGFSGPRGIECFAHVGDLAAEDVPKEVTAFDDILTFAESVEILFQKEVFFALLKQEQAKLGMPETKLVRHGATRFFTRIISLKQITTNCKPILAINADLITDSATKTKLRSVQMKLLNEIDNMAMLVDIFSYAMKHTPRLNCQRAYTISLELLFFVQQDNHLDELLKKEAQLRTSEDGDVGATGVVYDCIMAYKRASFRRRAAVAHWDVPEAIPEGIDHDVNKELTPMQKVRRVARDRAVQAAMLLDLAISNEDFEACGASTDHAKAHIIAVLKTAIIHMVEMDAGLEAEAEVSDGASAQPPAKKQKVDSRYASYEDEKDAITSQVKGKFESAGQFAERVAAEVAACKKRWNRGGSRMKVPKPGDINFGKWAESESQRLVNLEWSAFLEFREAHAGTPRYGEPMAPYTRLDEAGVIVDVPEKKERYTFWPSKKKTWPALYYCALVILGLPSTSTSNESAHSIAAYIMSKLRARLSDDNHEMLTLAKINIERDLKQKMAEKKLSPTMAAQELFRMKYGIIDVAALDAALEEV